MSDLTPEMERLFRDPLWRDVEHEPQIAVLLSEIDALRGKLEAAEKERDGWRVRHDAMEAIAAGWEQKAGARVGRLAAADAQIACAKDALAQALAALTKCRLAPPPSERSK